MLAALTGRTEVLEWLLQNTKNVSDVLEITKNVTKNDTKIVTGALDGGTADITNEMVSLSRHSDLACGQGRAGGWGFK